VISQFGRSFWNSAPPASVVGWGYIGVEQLDNIPTLPTQIMMEKLIRASERLSSSEEVRHPLLKGVQWAFGPVSSIIHWLFLMLLGFIGGFAGRHLYLRREWEKVKAGN
jgi:hypothetical protein